MTTTAKLAVATSILSLYLGMFIGQQSTQEKCSQEVPNFIVYTPKETKIKVEIRNTLMYTYSLDITKADWLADNVLIANQLYDVPIDKLLALISVESKFDEFALSPKDAVGFTQVVPSVWGDEIPYDVYLPDDNILAGAHILKNYKNDCGNWDCALKAYNIGITNFKEGKNQPAAKRYLNKIKSELKRLVISLSFKNQNIKGG